MTPHVLIAYSRPKIPIAWEIAVEAALGRIEIELDDLEEAVLKRGFEPLPIAVPHAVRTGRLPLVRRDPFRMLL